MNMEIPEKHFYTIGDVSRVTGTKPHILRYWESEFKLLRPARRYSGHRKYTVKDIELVNKIRFLIEDKKFTLAGAKREINKQYSPRSTENGKINNEASAMALLQDLKKEVEACIEILGPAEQPQLIEIA